MFKPSDYISKRPLIDTVPYGVTIVPCATDKPYWRVVVAHHLTPSENVGNRNVFVDTISDNKVERGRVLKFRQYTTLPWVSLITDKPLNEAGGNVNIQKNDTIDIFVAEDNVASEMVSGLHSRHADEGNGNTYGHHSFYIVWEKVNNSTPLPPVDEDKPEQPNPDCELVITQGSYSLAISKDELIKRLQKNTLTYPCMITKHLC